MPGPAELLDLSLPQEAAALRYVLLALAIAVSAGLAYRPRLAVPAAVALLAVATGFWIATLARPYGWLVERQATLRAGEIAIAGSGVPLAEGTFLAGDDRPVSGWARAAALTHAVGPLQALPTFAPPLAAALGALVLLGARPRRRAVFASVLWLVASVTDLDGLYGLGFVTSAWAHPGEAFGSVSALIVVLLLRKRPLLAALVLAVALLPSALASGAGRPALTDVLVAQGIWLPLGLLGLRRRLRDPADVLVRVSACWLLAMALLGRGNAWPCLVLLRVGLVLAAARVLVVLGRHAARALRQGSTPGLARALPFLLVAPGSLLLWWQPARLDPVVEASQERMPLALRRCLERVARDTPPGAVLAAGESLAPAVPALSARRVLRAPSIVVSDDEQRRLRTERLLVQGRPADDLVARYGISHLVMWQQDYPLFANAGGALQKQWEDEQGCALYAVRVPAPGRFQEE